MKKEKKMIIKLYPTVMRLPLSDKQKIILSTLISTKEALAKDNKPIMYQGANYQFYFEQRVMYTTLNIPQRTFKSNLAYLCEQKYIRYKSGCIPDSSDNSVEEFKELSPDKQISRFARKHNCSKFSVIVRFVDRC